MQNWYSSKTGIVSRYLLFIPTFFISAYFVFKIAHILMSWFDNWFGDLFLPLITGVVFGVIASAEVYPRLNKRPVSLGFLIVYGIFISFLLIGLVATVIKQGYVDKPLSYLGIFIPLIGFYLADRLIKTTLLQPLNLPLKKGHTTQPNVPPPICEFTEDVDSIPVPTPLVINDKLTPEKQIDELRAKLDALNLPTQERMQLKMLLLGKILDENNPQWRETLDRAISESRQAYANTSKELVKPSDTKTNKYAKYRPDNNQNLDERIE